jgi:acyl carrier protein phosphodiesterase
VFGKESKRIQPITLLLFHKLMESWRQLHKEELHDFYSSPNIIIVIRSRRMRWAGNVARRGRRLTYRGYVLGKHDLFYSDGS